MDRLIIMLAVEQLLGLSLKHLSDYVLMHYFVANHTIHDHMTI